MVEEFRTSRRVSDNQGDGQSRAHPFRVSTAFEAEVHHRGRGGVLYAGVVAKRG